MRLTEDDLCRAFANKIKESPEFASWVLGHTKFAECQFHAQLLHDEQARKRPRVRIENWWRHWWCKIPDIDEERETDIFLVFEIPNSKERFALHIENKKDSQFLRGQAERYRQRAQHMMRKERWLNYTEFETILLSPLAFRDYNKERCDLFDRYISYEDIATFVPEFSTLQI